MAQGSVDFETLGEASHDAEGNPVVREIQALQTAVVHESADHVKRTSDAKAVASQVELSKLAVFLPIGREGKCDALT